MRVQSFVINKTSTHRANHFQSHQGITKNKIGGLQIKKINSRGNHSHVYKFLGR
jgi:hypothetical protein